MLKSPFLHTFRHLGQDKCFLHPLTIYREYSCTFYGAYAVSCFFAISHSDIDLLLFKDNVIFFSSFRSARSLERPSFHFKTLYMTFLVTKFKEMNWVRVTSGKISSIHGSSILLSMPRNISTHYTLHLRFNFMNSIIIVGTPRVWPIYWVSLQKRSKS